MGGCSCLCSPRWILGLPRGCDGQEVVLVP